MQSGVVFNIQRYCVQDGPGIRTTVFLKGCPLCCSWCHNPEGVSPEPEIAVVETRCMLCGECRKACRFGESLPGEGMLPTQNEPCTMCEECIKACPTGARQVTGREMTVEDAVREVTRDRMFAELPQDWRAAYDAGIFTEFMEQRAPGHTVLDGKIYRKGMLDFKADIARAASSLDFLADPEAYEKRETLKSFDIACDAVIAFAAGHAALARDLADRETRPQRRAELLKIADVCDRVPAHAPRDFHEALQYYWFCHLAVITELNGWDSFNPGHLDQHLLPFYEQGLADGSNGSNGVSHILLDIVDEMHLLQPSTNIQLSRKSPDVLLKHALRVLISGPA